MALQRQTAIKCTVSEIISGNYVVREGWDPNYVKTERGEISRANIIGAVVSINDEKSFFFDDSTGQVTVRSFDVAISDDLVPGTVLNIIGRPRQFNEDIFILPEIIKKVENLLWIKLRQLELNTKSKSEDPSDEKTQEPTSETVEEKEIFEENPLDELPETEEPVQNIPDKIIEKIRTLDSGEGVDVEDLKEELKLADSEKYITRLLEEGHIFNIKPGRVKVLE